MTKKAILYMLISTLAFTLMNVTAKKMSHYNAYQLVFFRSLGTLVLTSAYLLYFKISFFGNNQKLLFLRAFVGLMSMSLFFMSLQHLPVGSAVTLRYLSPIFAAIFSIFLLKEKIILIRWLFFLIAFGGVIVLKFGDLQINLSGFTFIIGSAIFGGLVYIVINKIGKTEHPFTIVNYFMMVATIVGGFISMFYWKTPDLMDYLPLFSLGLFGFFGQLYMTKALQIDNINKIAPIKYMEVIFTVLISISFFNEGYTFWSLLGISMIIVGLVLNIAYKK